ncbi:MAG: TonB-dependent receptor, partial [Gammaproteobacteria bacterium]|nr:TonB-dependent receptor [Gammaproteobacteria bacterium]
TVVKLGVFYHWISDVLDLIPITDDFEAPGNIGKGRRWGLELESTIPLDAIGLNGAKLDFTALFQDTKVTDPVTGVKRRLSGQGGANAYRTLVNANRNIAYHLRMD